MKTDNIKEVKIDEAGRLCIFPEKEEFALIYRSATEVHWDSKNSCLYSPKPREWSYFDWYTQIISVIKTEYGYSLLITDKTLWANISIGLKQKILSYNYPH